MRFKLTTLFAASALAGLPFAAPAAEITVSLSIEDAQSSRPAALAKEFVQLVEKYTSGRLEVKLYTDAQLGNNKQALEGLQLGTVDMTKQFDTLNPLLPEQVAFDLPYLFKDRKHFERVMFDPVVWKTFQKLEAKGVVPVSWWENGYRHMTNNVRPIRVPDDLKGLKMRTPANPSRLAMFRLFGANPAPLPFPELYSALQQGAFDGQENPIANIVSARLYEVQKYLSLTSHVYAPQLLIFSKLKWDKLPQWARDAIKKAGDEIGQKWRDEAAKGDQEDLKVMAGSTQVNEVDFAAFQAASQPLYDAAKYPELVAHLLKLVKD